MDSKVDILVLGATGYTGKHAVKSLVQLCKEPEYADVRWGIAGRSRAKLQELCTELEELDVDLKRVLVVECDITKDSLSVVTSKTKILVNATGPNTLLSEPVVKACIETGTHYVDISAELSHMLNIYRTYNKAAEEANVLIVPSCGFDCIPVFGGLINLEKQFEGTLHTVECYNVLDIPKRAYFFPTCLIHYGTWESMIHEMHNFKQYRELKKQTFPDPEPVPQEINRRFIHRHDGRFWFPYPGADNDLVEKYQHYRKSKGYRTYHFRNYTTMPLLIHFFIIMPIFFLYYLMSHCACMRSLLWKYPRVFSLGYASHKGPSEEMRNGLKYSFTLTGKGWSKGADVKDLPDKTVTVQVSGCDPGYRTTGMALVLSALTILKEKSAMPHGGVLTAGAAYHDTQLVERLQKNGMNFHTIENKNV